jgi:hypothetical protein
MSEGGLPLVNPVRPIQKSNGRVADHPEAIQPTHLK